MVRDWYGIVSIWLPYWKPALYNLPNAQVNPGQPCRWRSFRTVLQILTILLYYRTTTPKYETFMKQSVLRLLVCQWIFPNSLAWVGGNIGLMACFTWELSVRGLDGNSKSIRHLFTNSLAATFMPVCRYMSTIAVENKILVSVWSNLIQFIQDGRYYKRFNVAFLPPLCGPELAHSLVLNSNWN